MTAFQKAEALAGHRYDRDKLLAMVDEVTTHFRMPNSFERSKMRAVCRYLTDALDRCSGSTLQQRWNDFEKRFWPKWKAGVDRRGRDYWTWGARALISARMIAPSLDMLSDLRVNQWIAHLPEDHPLAQQHTSLLQATNSITWTSAHSRQLAVSNGLRILLVRGYDSLHHIKDDDLKLLAVRWSKGTDALDAALCSLGVFSRTPKRGSARHGRRQRMKASELVESAGVPDRFRQVMILYLETYEARVSDVYRTLRHKVIALAHFGDSSGIGTPTLSGAPRFCRAMSATTSRMRSGALTRYSGVLVPATKCVQLHIAGWWTCAFSSRTSAPGQPNPTRPSSVSLRERFQRRATRFSGTVSTKHANAPELASQRRYLIWNARCRRFAPLPFSSGKLR